MLSPLLYRTEHFLRGEMGEKGAEKRGGRGVTRKRAKRKKGRVKTGQRDAMGAREVRRGTSSIRFQRTVPRSSSHIGPTRFSRAFLRVFSTLWGESRPGNVKENEVKEKGFKRGQRVGCTEVSLEPRSGNHCLQILSRRSCRPELSSGESHLKRTPCRASRTGPRQRSKGTG